MFAVDDVRAAVGNAGDIVPFAVDQEVAMKVNGHSLSGVPEEYVAVRHSISLRRSCLPACYTRQARFLHFEPRGASACLSRSRTQHSDQRLDWCNAQGRVSVRGGGSVAAGGQLKFEIIKMPKWGQFGWNNSVSGEFIYSPRDYSLETTNHGVESTEPIPGCKYDCSSCPNAIGSMEGVTLPTPPVADAECGPTTPDAATDSNPFIECDGTKTCCEGFRSGLADANNNQLIPIASTQQKRWVIGYECPTLGDPVSEGGWTQAEQDLYDQAQSDRDIKVPSDVKKRIECKDVPPRLCVTHMAAVPYDEFKFRASNAFGYSNWATVKIVFERADGAAGFLQFTVLCAGILMTMTCCGLLRVIALQLILQPYRRYVLCGKLCGAFCAPPPEAFVLEKIAADYKPDFLKDGYEETSNPIIADDDE